MPKPINVNSYGKPQNFLKSIKRLFSYIKVHLKFVIIAIILAILGTVCTLVGPNLLSEITDIVTDGTNYAQIYNETEFKQNFNSGLYELIISQDSSNEYYDEATESFLIPIIVDGEEIVTSFKLEENGSIYVTYNSLAKVNLVKITKIAVTLIILYSLGVVFNYMQGFIMSGVSQQISKKLRTDITKKINKLPLNYFDTTSYGDTLSIITNDVDTINQTFNSSVSNLVSAIILFFGSLSLMFVHNYIMAFSAIGAVFIGFLLMMLIMKKSQKYFLLQQENLGNLNGVVEESYSGHDIISVYNAEKEFDKKFDDVNKLLYVSNWKSQFISGIMNPIMAFMGNFGYVVVCVVGAVLLINNFPGVSVGTITAFMIYIRFFTQPLSQIAQAMTNIQSAAAGSERVFDFLDQSEMDDESDIKLAINDVKGNVEFDNVYFGYNQDKMIIKDFNLSVKAGQKIAIVGSTGAGKTTIVNLLMRFYEITKGKIKIDGIETNKITRDNVHRLFGMVLQDTWLFEGSIKENLIFNTENVTDEQIVNACKACGIDYFIRTLPNGYNTILDDNTSISAGQKQLLTIARAMIQNSPMLILDEATSSVDTRSEEYIQKAMDKLTKSRTSFIIAHRLSTIKNADLIIYMKDGTIAESGKHNELLRKNGAYAELYNSQFQS